MKEAVVYLRVDVANAHLDVAGAGGQVRCFGNDKRGRAALLAWVKEKGAVQLICEASGGYEEPLLESLAEGEVIVTLIQATRVRAYARAAGILAKTDRVDAQVLGLWGRAPACAHASSVP